MENLYPIVFESGRWRLEIFKVVSGINFPELKRYISTIYALFSFLNFLTVGTQIPNFCFRFVIHLLMFVRHTAPDSHIFLYDLHQYTMDHIILLSPCMRVAPRFLIFRPEGGTPWIFIPKCRTSGSWSQTDWKRWEWQSQSLPGAYIWVPRPFPICSSGVISNWMNSCWWARSSTSIS